MLTTTDRKKQRRQRVRAFHKNWTPATLFYLSLITALAFHTGEYFFLFLLGSLILYRWLMSWMEAGDEYSAMDFGSFMGLYGLLVFFPFLGISSIATGYIVQGIICLAMSLVPIVAVTIFYIKDQKSKTLSS